MAIALILVVDDSDAVRTIVRGILVSAGYEVVEAEDGPTAVAAYQQRRPDGVLIDIQMPGPSGIALLRDLRVLDPSVRAAMLTGVRTPETVAEAVHLHVRDYVAKPFTAQRLRDAVRRLLA